MPMQLLWHRQNDLSKFVGFGTREQTCEPVKTVDELVKVADDLWVIATKYSADIDSVPPLWAIVGES